MEEFLMVEMVHIPKRTLALRNRLVLGFGIISVVSLCINLGLVSALYVAKADRDYNLEVACRYFQKANKLTEQIEGKGPYVSHLSGICEQFGQPKKMT